MNEAHKQFQDALEALYTFFITEKALFLEELLFYFTIAGRGIWSDDNPTDAEKVEAFKWLNELIHRIWNIRSELIRGEDNDSITSLYNEMKFYSEKSDLLRMQLVSTFLGASNNYSTKYH